MCVKVLASVLIKTTSAAHCVLLMYGYGGGLYGVGGEELGKIEVWLVRVNGPRGTEMRDTRSYMRQVTRGSDVNAKLAWRAG